MSNYPSLRDYNSFRIDSVCRSLVHISDENQLDNLKVSQQSDVLILGGGSNILCAQHIDKTILHNAILGIKVVEESEDTVILKVGGGEGWSSFVDYCVDHGYGGIENLSLIPGTVGAAPVQNIGAYGVEQDQLFVKLKAFDFRTHSFVWFNKEACQFGYRDSRFKSRQKGRYFITHVYYRLTKRNHSINISYGAIKDELLKRRVTQIEAGIKDISDVVKEIRQFKLPNPSFIPNAGSFFKNPVITYSHFKDLQLTFPEMVHYVLPNGDIKVPAGWLIDQCGWKGKRVGNVGTYINQALVIVNHGDATGEEIVEFSRQIQQSVMDTYGILLIPEVNHWGF